METSPQLLPRALTPASSAHLDLIRAIASWAVMWGHVRSSFFVDYGHVQNKKLTLGALYFITGLGHQAVMVFFVLSGFLISSSILHSYVTGRWSWREYWINRASRLYVVLIPGLLLGFMWDKLGSTFFAATGVYSRLLEAFGGAIPVNQLTIGSFTGNLLFLQTILCPTFGSNGPLWSLANEFWYYVLFPIAMFAAVSWAGKSVGRALSLTVLSACVIWFLGWEMFVGFLVWLSGFGLVLAYSKIRWRSRFLLAVYGILASCAFAVCIAAARMNHPKALGNDLAVGIAFTLLLLAVLCLDLGARPSRYHAFARFFAGFSYSLYVLHFPFLMFLRAWMVPSERWQPDAVHLAFGATIGLVTLIFAWAVSVVTENKTILVRRWIRGALPQLAVE